MREPLYSLKVARTFFKNLREITVYDDKVVFRQGVYEDEVELSKIRKLGVGVGPYIRGGIWGMKGSNFGPFILIYTDGKYEKTPFFFNMYLANDKDFAGFLSYLKSKIPRLELDEIANHIVQNDFSLLRIQLRPWRRLSFFTNILLVAVVILAIVYYFLVFTPR